MEIPFLKLNKILHSSDAFFANVARLSSSSFLAQGIVIVSVPLLTRIYSDSQVGVLGTFAAATFLLIVPAMGKYEMAILLPEDEEVACQIFRVVILLLAFFTGLLVLLPLILFHIPPLINSWILTYYWYLPISVFFSGLFIAARYFSMRRKHFALLSKTLVYQRIFQFSVQIGVGFFWPSVHCLIIGFILGQSMGTFWLLKPHRQELLATRLPRKTFMHHLRMYRQFPLLTAPSTMLNTSTLQAIPFILTGLFGPAVTGLYYISMRIITLPSAFVGSSIAQVYAAQIGNYWQTDRSKVSSLFWICFFPLLFIGLVLSAGIFLYADKFIVLFLGQSWANAVPYCKSLVPILIGGICIAPLCQLSLMDNHFKGMIINVLRFVVTAAVFSYGWKFSIPVLELLMMYALAILMCQVLLFLFTISSLRPKKHELQIS